MRRAAISLLLVYLFSAAPIFGETPEITRGLGYLSSAQNADGSWGRSSSFKENVSTTVTAIETFKQLNQTDQPNYTNGLLWLRNQPLDTTEDISERMRLFTAAGSDKDKLLSYIDKLSNAWGGYDEYSVSIIDTALALQALRTINYTDSSTIRNVLAYLVQAQNPDGGWGFYKGGRSNAYMSSTVIKTLTQFKTFYPLQPNIDKAVAYLLSKRNADGGFGSSPSSVHETALAFDALVATGADVSAVTPGAIGYIAATQQANGSWNDDPYSTSLALRVLAQAKPSLSISSSDVTYAPVMPAIGDSVTISVGVKNNSYNSANNVIASFYDGDPKSGGIAIGERVIPTLAPTGSAVASLSWIPGASGNHTIYLILDPDERIPEENKTDNTAISRITVYEKIDLAVSAITFIPDLPAPGQAVDARIAIANRGGLPAQNAVIRLMVDGMLAQDKTLSAVSSLQNQTVTFTIPDVSLGLHQVTAIVDPDSIVSESSKTNNSLAGSFEVKKRVDLLVHGINMTNTNPKEGETIRIAAVVYNAEVNGADTVRVRIYDGTPGGGGVQIGDDLIVATVPGLATGMTDWVAYATAGKEGSHSMYAVVDPLNATDETNEYNNSLAVPLVVKGRPDLVVSDLLFSPAAPEEGDVVQIRAVVKNTGSMKSGTTKFSLSLGDPAVGGQQIGYELELPEIASNGTLTTDAVLFDSASRVGNNQLFALVDPHNVVEEVDEANNGNSKTLAVLPSSRPDLSLSGDDITFSPKQPAMGDTVTIAAAVRNLRDAAAENVLINYYDGDPAAGGVLIGSSTMPVVNGKGTYQASTTWTMTGITGKHVVYVKVDPNSAVPEANKGNNTASAVFKVRLPQTAAPVNLTATPSGATSIALAWEPGPESEIHGVAGYNVYRNSVWVNNYRDIAKEGAAAASSSQSGSPASSAIDSSAFTYWSPTSGAALPQWWREDFAAPRKLKKIAVNWESSNMAKNYEVQTFVDGQWTTQASVTGNTKAFTLHEFASAVTTTSVRIYVTQGTYSAYAAQIGNVRVYESRSVTANGYQDSALGPGTRSYSVTAVDGYGNESLPCPAASAKLGDATPPAAPVGLTGSVSYIFNINTAWSANTESDLAGYRIYRKGLNVAQSGRGGRIYAQDGMQLSQIIDGIWTNGGYVLWSEASPAVITVSLARVYEIDKIRIRFDDKSDQFYKFRIESSLDGKSWQPVADQTGSSVHGLQEFPFAQSIQAQYFRITGTFASKDNKFSVNEFEAITHEFALATPEQSSLYGWNVPPYANFADAYWDYSPGARQPVKFQFTTFDVEEKDALYIYDKDSNLLLASYTGKLGSFETPWLISANFRLQFVSDDEGTAAGFTIGGTLMQYKRSSTAYAEQDYSNGSYEFAVTAVDTSANESALSTGKIVTIADSTPPMTPQNFKATAGNGSVALSWTWDSSSLDLAGYNLYRNGDTTPLNKSLVGYVTGAPGTYLDSEVLNLTAYTYRLEAVDLNGNKSQKTAVVSATPSGVELAIGQADVSFRPRFPTVFDDITVFAMVHNTGTDNLPGPVQATLYKGNPLAGGTVIANSVINGLPAGEATQVVFNWNPTGSTGTNPLYIVVDSSNGLAELDESNNTTSFSATVNPEPSLRVEATHIDSSNFPEIAAHVRVGDWAGEGISTLTAANFTVKEDGVDEKPLSVTLLNSPGHKPLVDIVFVFDDTGSMIPFADGLKQKSFDFVNKLGNSNLDYTLGLVVFEDVVHVINSGYLTGNDNTFMAWVNALNPLQGSGGDVPEASLDALNAALGYNFRQGAQKVFVLITDAPPHIPGDGTAYSKETVSGITQKLLDAGVTAYIVGPDLSKPEDVKYAGIYSGMGSLSQVTNGKFYTIDASSYASAVDDISKSIVYTLCDYKVTYNTHNVARDGAVRNVSVEASYRAVPGNSPGQYVSPSSALPDLAVNSLSLSEAAPVSGNAATLSAVLQNLGGAAARDVLARFYDGDPGDGLQIGADQMVSAWPAGGLQTLSVNWIAIPGMHTINVVVDPGNSVSESNEANNRAIMPVSVAGVATPEIGVNSNDITVTKSVPLKGEATTIKTTVHNSGSDAADVLVAAYLGDPRNGGVLIGSHIISFLPANSSAQLETAWLVDKPQGNYEVYVWADPYNQLRENNKADNLAAHAVTITERELGVKVTTDKQSYAADANAGISALVTNETSSAWSGTGALLLEDEFRNAIVTLGTFTVNGLPPAGLPEWHYRVPVTVSASWELKDALAKSSLDFASLLNSLGIGGKAVDRNSVRVLELDASGNILGEKQAGTVFQGDTAAAVTWLVDGTTPKGSARYFAVYFDTLDNGSKAPSLKVNLPTVGKLLAYSDDSGKIYVLDGDINEKFGQPRFVDDVSGSYSDYTRGIALQDFNNDGFLDIVTGSGATGDIYYYQNKADGTNTFMTKVKIGNIVTGVFIMGMAAGDFNKDGNLDFAVSGSNSRMYVFKGNGDGTFTQSELTAASANHFRAKTAIDFDNDGNLDLLTATDATAMYLYRGRGDGTFDAPVTTFTNPGYDSYGLASGDFDDDGKTDILINSRSMGSAYFLKGKGDGTFASGVPVPMADASNYTTWAAGDFNNDGLLDVIASIAPSNTVAFYPGRGDGTFGQKTAIATAATIAYAISSGPALAEVRPAVGAPENVPSMTASYTWNTGTTQYGNYAAHAVLQDAAGARTENSAPFSIAADRTIDAGITLDKNGYMPNENAVIRSSVVSRSRNAILNNMTAKIAIRRQAPSGEVLLFAESKAIAALVPQDPVSMKSYWNVGVNAPGNYQVGIDLFDGSGTLLSSGTGTLVINSTSRASALLKGSISLDKQRLLSGEPVTASFTMANAGNTDPQGIAVSVLTVKAANQSVVSSIADQASLLKGDVYTASRAIDTTDFGAKDYLVILKAEIDGIEETLASTYFRIEGAPSAPALAGPVSGSDTISSLPTLTISNASDPNEDELLYEFEIYSEAGLGNLVASSGLRAEGSGGMTAWTVAATLSENQAYFWRARAYDGWLYGSWMSPATFRVNAVNDPPSAPTLAAPENGFEVSTLTPGLSVGNATDPDSVDLTYNFEVALDPGFTQIAASTVGIAGGQGTTSWQVPANVLQENTWYYWRSQADDWLITGPWSVTGRFFVNTSNEAPTVPVIQVPLDGAVIEALETDITIQNSTDPDSPVITYFFELDRVNTFDSAAIVRSGAIAQGLTSWRVTGLRENTQYSVRVKASDGQADSAWSAIAGFFANAVNEAPAIPVLANPSNGAGVTVFTPGLSLHNALDPDRDFLTYDFEVYGDPALAAYVTGTTGVPEAAQVTSWTVDRALSENRTYYWRARAFDGQVASNWTGTNSFMVNTANDAPGAPIISLPAPGGSVSTTTPPLTVINAVDPDSAVLTCDFEIYSSGVLAQTATGIAQDASGTTSVILPAPLSDNTVYQWRARAFDGQLYGPWSAMASFTVHMPRTGINVDMEFEPETLNKKSSGTWVTVKIELPHGFKASDVDVASIRLEETVPAETRPYLVQEHHEDGCDGHPGSHDHVEIMVKFKRSEAIKVLPVGEKVPVHVTGKAGNATFDGVDIIRVID